MKTYCLSFTLFILTLNFVSEEIRNGYANGIHSAWESLKNLQALLHDDEKKTPSEMRKIEVKLKEVVNYIAYYELTQNLLTFATCTQKSLPYAVTPVTPGDGFLSAHYSHFEGGVLFRDVGFGLDVLWEASFKHRRVYKENLGFFVSDGLVILPNRENTSQSARLSALPTKIMDSKLYVQFDGNYVQVLGIIHTHIEGMAEPSPRNDYQYSYMGIHNYVMGYLYLFDAYKDREGEEVCRSLGPRNAYAKIVMNDMNLSSYAPAFFGLVAKDSNQKKNDRKALCYFRRVNDQQTLRINHWSR